MLPIFEKLQPDGAIPEADVRSLTEFGRLLRARFSKPVAALEGAEGDTIVLKLPEAQEIDHVILQEQIKHGERIRDHVVEGLVGEEWGTLAEDKSPAAELVLTGRHAHDRVIERADLVTEMRCIKHYFASGVPARVGIEM